MIFALAKRLFHDYGVNYSSSLLGFVIVMMAARILGADQFAWLAAGLAFGGFVIPLTTLGSEFMFVRDAVNASDAAIVEQMAIRSFGMRLTALLVIGGLLLVFTPIYARSLLNSIAITLISLWAGMQGLYPASWYDYLNKTRLQNAIVFGERVGSVALVCGVWLLPESLHLTVTLGLALFLARALSIAVQVKVWLHLAEIRHFPLRLKLPRNSDGINLKVTAASVSNAMLVYGNQLFLRGNKIELAAYGLAFQILGLIFIFQGQAQRLLSRRVVEDCKHRETARKSLRKGILLIGGGSMLLAVAAWILIDFLPLFLADPKYKAMSQFTPLLCAWVIVAGVGVAVAQHLMALGQESFYLASAIGGGAIAFGLGATLIPHFGGIAVIGILLGVHMLIIIANMAKIRAVAALLPSIATAPSPVPVAANGATSQNSAGLSK